jgi:CelD/BcsL family acetyltransferase involved in cellulose biosynthesis
MPLPLSPELDASIRIEEVGCVAPNTEWSRLLAAAHGASVFQSWEWIGAWTDYFLPRHARPTRIACTEASALRAQAWLYRCDRDAHDRWLLLGSGISDNLDPLIDARHATSAAAALFYGLQQLARQAPLELLQLSAGSPLVECARRAGCTVTPAEPCLAVDVQDGARLESIVNGGLARAIAYARRRLGREGLWSIDDATPATLHALLDRLFDLHSARWRARGEAGVLADATVCAFHRTVAAHLLGRGLVLRALQLNGRIIACHYGFRTADRELYYIGGFDPAAARLSPGLLLLADAFERTRADGLQWLDLLRGREPYKYAWGAREQPHVRILMV